MGENRTIPLDITLAGSASTGHLRAATIAVTAKVPLACSRLRLSEHCLQVEP